MDCEFRDCGSLVQGFRFYRFELPGVRRRVVG